jgi:hypothetical protein
LGDAGAEGVMPFYLFGIHYTEISRRHLLPVFIGKQILHEWIQTATFSSKVEWEEI